MVPQQGETESFLAVDVESSLQQPGRGMEEYLNIHSQTAESVVETGFAGQGCTIHPQL